MEPSTPIRVLIVDDHPVFRDGLALLLGREADIDVVGTAPDGRTTLALCERDQVDVLLVDLRMAGMDGLSVVTEVSRRWPATRSLVLSGFGADEDIYQAVRAGAAGYVLKDAGPEELASAVRKVARGDMFLPAALAAKLASHVSRPHLTPRQDEVLHLIAQGLSNQEIAKRLNIVEGTVKAHVKIILSKLGARDRTQAVSVALTRGLVRP